MNNIRTLTKKKIWLYKILILLILFIIVSFGALQYKGTVTVEIFYRAPNSNSLNNRKAEIYFDHGSGFASEDMSSALISKRLAILENVDEIENLEQIRIDFIDTEEVVQVDNIKIRSGVFSIGTFSGQTIFDNASFLNVKTVQVIDGALEIVPDGADSQCVFNSWFTDCFIRAVQQYSIFNNIVLMALNLLFFIILTWIIFHKVTYEEKSVIYFYKIGCVIVCIGAVLVILMAGFSRTYGHPDEDVTALAIDYYVKYWGLPDFTTPEARNTFSNYGSTRLAESSIYYFLAGKVGGIFKSIFHIHAYYRCFNVLLFIIMAFLFVRKGKRCPWIIIGIVFSPQLLYIFSYGTSDAWDYFLSFLTVSSILDSESRFNKALRSKKFLKYFDGIVLEGIGFSLLFWGKRNYYLVFLICFIILLMRLFRGKNVKQFIYKYAIILSIFVICIALRWGVDVIYYNGEKNEQIQIIQDSAISDEDIENLSSTLNLKESDVTFWEMFSDYKFAEKTYKSFWGYYGWMTYESGFFYYLIIFAVYVNLILIQIKNIVVQKRTDRIIELCLAHVMIILLFMVSFVHSWTADFQPQGRYLLSAIMSVLWIEAMCSKNKNADRRHQVYAYVLAGCGFYSFIVYGMTNLIL